MTETTEQSIIAGIERLPLSRWHTKMRLIIGSATFFDGHDGLSIGYVLPALIGAWHLNPGQIGWIVTIGFVGQGIGSALAGWFAEIVGRVRALQVMMLLLGILTVACAVATSYDSLFWIRLFQGIAIGGEVPVAAAYISEILPTRNRGRYFLIYELAFLIGITAASILGAWIVPRFGWQWLFVVGGVPALLIAPLCSLCIESPRWLASKGRLADAQTALDKITAAVAEEGKPIESPEAHLKDIPVPVRRGTSWAGLFEGIYLKRTISVWFMWSAAYLLSKNLLVWLPSLYVKVYKLPVQEALNLGIITTVLSLLSAVLTAYLVDISGRKAMIAIAFLLSAASCLVPYLTGAADAMEVVVLGNAAAFFVGVACFSLYLYTPELYPTRIRALGTSVATFWVRVTSIVSTPIIGYLVPNFGIASMFLLFTVCSLIGAAACLWGVVETRGQTLEQIAA